MSPQSSFALNLLSGDVASGLLNELRMPNSGGRYNLRLKVGDLKTERAKLTAEDALHDEPGIL